MSLSSIGLLFSFCGAIMMLPESFRLSKKNPEGALSFSSGYNDRWTGFLFSAGIVFMIIGNGLQFTASHFGF